MNLTMHHKVIKNELGLLELAKELGSFSPVCKILGYSREIAITDLSSCTKKKAKKAFKKFPDVSQITKTGLLQRLKRLSYAFL